MQQPRSNTVARAGLRLVLHAGLSLVAMLATAGIGVAACTSEVSGGCIGGIIVAGQCQAKCEPAKCLPGNTCVNNECVLQCTTHDDCNIGTQNCVPGKEDGTKSDIMICKESGLAAAGTSCPFLDCSSLTACPGGKFCDFTQCGGAECKRDAIACGDDAACLKGLCPDKTRCFMPGCSQDQCTPALTCQSKGDSDADAYCTIPDCVEDQDCPGGFYCGIVRDPHAVCNAMPAKGNTAFCGKTTDPCIDPASPPAGTSYFEGSNCLLRRMCLKRFDCTPCKDSLDCSLTPGQSCVGTGPNGTDMRCTLDCNFDSDCGNAYHCVSGACVPRFQGGCVGSGNFCEPCQNDEDCGPKGSSRACLVQKLSGERMCFDRAFSVPCDPAMNDLDCPVAPGGRHGHCLSDTDGYSPGDLAYHKCYLPYDAKNFKYTCW